MKEGVELEEQRSKRSFWPWVAGAVVVVLLLLVAVIVRPWGGLGQRVAGVGNSGTTQKKATGSAKPTLSQQTAAGLWEPAPIGVLPENPASYSDKITVVRQGKTAKVGAIELKVLGVRYADPFLPGQIPQGNSKPYKDLEWFRPLIAVDVSMRNAGSKPLQLWPVGRRFGFVEIEPDGTVRAVGQAVNDQARYSYEIWKVSTAVVPSSPQELLFSGAFYRDVPAFLEPGQSVSFSVLVRPTSEGAGLNGFADGHKEYGLTLSPDASEALVQGHERDAHAWFVASIGTLGLVRDASLREYDTPRYAADPLPAEVLSSGEAENSKQQGVDISKIWGFLPGINGVSTLQDPKIALEYSLAMESSMGWAGLGPYYMFDPLPNSRLPEKPPYVVDRKAVVTKNIGETVSLPDLGDFRVSTPSFDRFMDHLYVQLDATAKRRVPSGAHLVGNKWVARGPWREVDLNIDAANLVLVASDGQILSFADDTMSMLSMSAAADVSGAFPLGLPWMNVKYGRSASGWVRFEIPYRVQNGSAVAPSKKVLGQMYVMLVGQDGSVYAMWTVNAADVPAQSAATG